MCQYRTGRADALRRNNDLHRRGAEWLALPKTFQVLHCRIIELNQSRGRVFLQVLDLRRSGNRKHYRGFPKQPRKRELRWLGVEALRCARQWTLMFRPWMLRAAVLDSFVGSGPLKAGFGRDQEIGRIGMQCLGDKTFANYGAV